MAGRAAKLLRSCGLDLNDPFARRAQEITNGFVALVVRMAPGVAAGEASRHIAVAARRQSALWRGLALTACVAEV